MDEDKVQRTASDAARAKTSMSRLGYYQDPFISSFLGLAGGARCPPLINRGYYARYKSIDTVVRSFLASCAKAGSQSQVVVLGGGSDTMYLRFKRETLQDNTASDGHIAMPTQFVELDLLENAIHKVHTISRSTEMMSLLGFKVKPKVDTAGVNDGHDSGYVCDPRRGVLRSKGYHVMPCDLRDTGGLDKMVITSGLNLSTPTLFLSECVLIYLEPKHVRFICTTMQL